MKKLCYTSSRARGNDRIAFFNLLYFIEYLILAHPKSNETTKCVESKFLNIEKTRVGGGAFEMHVRARI